MFVSIDGMLILVELVERHGEGTLSRTYIIPIIDEGFSTTRNN